MNAQRTLDCQSGEYALGGGVADTLPEAVHTDLYDRLDVIPFGRLEEFFRKYL